MLFFIYPFVVDLLKLNNKLIELFPSSRQKTANIFAGFSNSQTYVCLFPQRNNGGKESEEIWERGVAKKWLVDDIYLYT